MTEAIEIGPQGIVSEVVLPEARGEELDLKGGVGIDPLEDIDEIDIEAIKFPGLCSERRFLYPKFRIPTAEGDAQFMVERLDAGLQE